MHKGMTQEELSEKMAVSRQTISKWELGYLSWDGYAAACILPSDFKDIIPCFEKVYEKDSVCYMDGIFRWEINKEFIGTVS